MKYVPKSVTRFSHRSLLKFSAKSPTIMVVAGVIGLGATAVLAAKATRRIDPVLEEHNKTRYDIKGTVYQTQRGEQKALVGLYAHTGRDLARIYGPTILVGTLSTASVLYGHKILHGRHVASIAAYTGLMEQMQAYRARVAKTVGKDVERTIFDGAYGEWVEDPDHKGEYKLTPKFDPEMIETSYLRPVFDHRNPNWTPDPIANFVFLKGVQSHTNDLLQINGHVTLNDVCDALRLPRTNAGMVAGWVWNSDVGDNRIDFGFLTSDDPQSIAFREGVSRDVRLNFNVQGNVYGLMKEPREI
jgi:hypothetical protein